MGATAGQVWLLKGCSWSGGVAEGNVASVGSGQDQNVTASEGVANVMWSKRGCGRLRVYNVYRANVM